MSASAPLGRYVLLQRLAVGGMAEIFLAKAVRQAGVEKTCVVKRVLPHLAENPAFVRMFLDEARVAALLNHPGIVQLFDFGREGQDYFYAMEYLAGEDVAAIMTKSAVVQQPVPMPVAVLIVARAAEALHYSHEATTPDGRPLNLVHRDVSPSNLFVTYQGAVKVLDFGIARTSDERLEQTEAGQIKGKAAYMAPEQLQHGALDRRTDVWALGACLYELLTGTRPFAGLGIHTTGIDARLGPLVGPSSLRPEVPTALSDIALKALESRPEDRFQTAEALQLALEELLGAWGVSERPSLSAFLRNLFGVQRAAEKLQRGLLPSGPSAPSAVTQELDARASPPRELETEGLGPRGMPGRRSAPGGRRRWLGAVGITAALLWGAGVYGLRHRDSTRPLPRAELQASVAPTSAQSAGSLATRLRSPMPEAPAPSAAALPAPSLRDAPSQLAATRPTRERVRARLTDRSGGAAVAAAAKTGLAKAPLTRPEASHPHGLKVATQTRVPARSGEDHEPSAARGRAILNVVASPWADVWLDDVNIGQTPLAGRSVWEGQHTLRLVGPKGEKRLPLNLIAGEVKVVKVQLEP